MSELKAGVIITPHDEGMSFDRGSDAIAVTERETEFYLKAEADKVIAELKESVKGLILDNYLKDKETRHNKYKLCLAMASYWVVVSYQCVDDKHRRSAERHHRKWLELAEQFKEGDKCRG